MIASTNRLTANGQGIAPINLLKHSSDNPSSTDACSISKPPPNLATKMRQTLHYKNQPTV
jgi:hypothetical protein